MGEKEPYSNAEVVVCTYARNHRKMIVTEEFFILRMDHPAINGFIIHIPILEVDFIHKSSLAICDS